jgi:hypothetical protein
LPSRQLTDRYISSYVPFTKSRKIIKGLCDVVSRIHSVGVPENPASPVLHHPVMQCHYHVKSNKYMSVYVHNRVMEIFLGVSVLLGLQLKSVQINNIHAIVFVHRLGSRALLSALVNAALEVEHHLILIERESLLFPDQSKHILEIRVRWGSHDDERVSTYWRAEREECVVLLSPKKLPITRIVYNSLHTLLKSKHVAVYLLHA